MELVQFVMHLIKDINNVCSTERSAVLVGVCLSVLNHFIYSSRANFKPASASPAGAPGKLITCHVLGRGEAEDHSQNLLWDQDSGSCLMIQISLSLCTYLKASKKVSKYKN